MYFITMVVIASLWAVDDHATYLLMSCFAQLYLNPQRTFLPARALAEAQRWLRAYATNSVLMTYDPIPVFAEGEQRQRLLEEALAWFEKAQVGFSPTQAYYN